MTMTAPPREPVAITEIDRVIERLQMDIDDGGRPDMWSMQSMQECLRKARAVLAAPAPSADKPMLDPRYCHHAWEYGQRYVGCVVHCGKPQPPHVTPAAPSADNKPTPGMLRGLSKIAADLAAYRNGTAPSAEPPAQAATDDGFDSWWRASKYCQVVCPERGWEQIARDGYRAGVERQAREIARLDARNLELCHGWSSQNERAERAEAERDALRAVIERAANVMHGDGVMDQGQAWDECVRVLDAERAKVRT